MFRLPVLPETLAARLPDGRQWPCAVRRSSRARRVRLHVDARGAARLVLPARSRVNATHLEALLADMTPWLQKTLDRLRIAEPPPNPGDVAALRRCLPDSISLPVRGTVWQVYAVDESDGPPRLRAEKSAHGGRLVLRGPLDDAPAACALLQRWLRAQARQCLPPMVHAQAERMGLVVRQVRIGAQKGRWGSCSVGGTVSLNCLLLLLPPSLVTHVILHELCHMRHMNHSIHYREYLQSYAPDWKVQEKMLQISWQSMPTWAIIR